jgi:hypothetical protein
LPRAPQPDFILAAGDDVTDEDLFAQLPASAWTIHVGRNRSRAKYYVEGPDEMIALISEAVESLSMEFPPNNTPNKLPELQFAEPVEFAEIPIVGGSGFARKAHSDVPDLSFIETGRR